MNLEDHKLLAENMDWEDLVEIIIDIELEIFELKDLMKNRELKKYEKILQIYEKAKEELIILEKERISSNPEEPYIDILNMWNYDKENY